MAARIYIEGAIVNAVSAWDMDTSLQSVRAQYEAQSSESEIIAYVKSYGGDVREGYAIRDFLRSLGKPITTIATGEVYSIATVVFLAGDKGKRKMMPNAELMIHNPWTSAGGSADDLERYAEMLRAEEVALSQFYAAETGQPVELLRDMMNAETYLKASDAVTLGFADEVLEEVRAFAMWTPKDLNIEHMTENEKTILQKLAGLFKNEAPATVEPAIAEVPVTDEPNQTELLKAELEAIKAEIEALKAVPAPTPDPELVAMAQEFKTFKAQLMQLIADETTPAGPSKPVKAESANVESKPKAQKEGVFAVAEKYSKL